MIEPRYCYSLCVVVVVLQKLTFCYISVITEDTYLKLGVRLVSVPNIEYFHKT